LHLLESWRQRQLEGDDSAAAALGIDRENAAQANHALLDAQYSDSFFLRRIEALSVVLH
jgi:hypothetical protein